MTDHIVFLTNNHSGFCGATLLCKKYSTIINTSIPGSSQVFTINFSKPYRALRSILLLTKEARSLGTPHYIFNYPLPGHYSRLFYLLLVPLLSLRYKTSVLYHGYFHVSLLHSFSAILLLAPSVRCRYYVAKDFLQRMHPLWGLIYHKLTTRYLPVLPLLDTSNLNPKPDVIPVLNPTSQITFSLHDFLSMKYLLYYGIPSPQKRIPLAYLIARSLHLPLIICSSDIPQLQELLPAPISGYPGLILISPPSDSLMTYLIAHAEATINVPIGGLGDWSSTWLSTRSIGTLVISSSTTNLGYDSLSHTYCLGSEVDHLFVPPPSLTSLLGSKKVTYQSAVDPASISSAFSIA